MTEISDVIPPQAAATPAQTIRPLYWSLRRELWENRAIYVAPLAVAGLLLAGFAISLNHLPDQVRNLGFDGPPLSLPYNIAALALIVTTLLVSAFYALGALHGERRDRSILFWKSLPVSDLVTVGAKALVPLVILPAVAFILALAVQLIMLLVSTLVLLANGLSPAVLYANVPIGPSTLVMAYGLATLAIWLSPVWAWFLLVSAWARRTPFLWAILPPMGLGLVEKMALQTNYVSSLIGRRLTGAFNEAFAPSGPGQFPGIHQPTIDAAHFFASPQTWLGVVVAAGLLYATVRVRRYKEPA